MPARKIYFTVTTDLTYDQRMIRICTSLAQAGYDVVLVGRKVKKSIAVNPQPFEQKRIACLFEKGKLFYLEYNLRLFFFLLFKKMDCICAIDLDTILPCLFISKFKKTKRVYDAHELFCEMKEVVSRPSIYRFWKAIERYSVPSYTHGYTVNKPIADEFRKMYAVDYSVIRNIALLKELTVTEKEKKFILYQGAVNEGRSFETLIPAMKKVNCELHIYGDGNFLMQAQQLVANNNLQDKIFFKGKAEPNKLWDVTQKATIGITIFENNGLSNYFSLGNRFFDYMQAGVPQVCVDYPVYREINDKWNFALLIEDTSEDKLAAALNQLLTDENLYKTLQQNCIAARQQLNWQQEEKVLIQFYKNLLG